MQGSTLSTWTKSVTLLAAMVLGGFVVTASTPAEAAYTSKQAAADLTRAFILESYYLFVNDYDSDTTSFGYYTYYFAFYADYFVGLAAQNNDQAAQYYVYVYNYYGYYYSTFAYAEKSSLQAYYAYLYGFYAQYYSGVAFLEG